MTLPSSIDSESEITAKPGAPQRANAYVCGASPLSWMRRGLTRYGFDLEVSLGWAIFPTDATSSEDLVVVADMALRESKRSHGGGREWAVQGSNL